MTRKQKMEKKIQRQQELLDLAKTENRSMSENEEREFNVLQQDIEELRNEQEEQSGSIGEAEAERERILTIQDLCRSVGVEADDYIRNKTTVEAVRATLLENLIAAGAPIPIRGTNDITVQASEEDKFRSAAADALVMRGGVSVEKPADGANELRGISLRDLAIETLQKTGESGLNRKSNDELFVMLNRDYHTPTSLFPAILDTAINKAYVEGHKKAGTTFETWVKKGSLSDFKTQSNNYLAGPAGDFLMIPEGGELKHDIPTDEKMPSRQLRTYGRQFTMTREAFINDDIGFLSSIPAKYAAAAKRTQNKQVYEVLTKNPAIYDGTPLFSVTHKNTLTTGTGITLEVLQKMFLALQMQKNQFKEAIVIRPAILILPVGYKFTMETILNSPTINTVGNTQAVNPLYSYRNGLEIVEDATLNVLAGESAAVPWYLVGDNNDVSSIQIDYLNGQEIPTIRRMEKSGQLGFTWDIYLDWGITVMDFRGIIRNPGVPIANPLD
jgi:hypothetical protein